MAFGELHCGVQLGWSVSSPNRKQVLQPRCSGPLEGRRTILIELRVVQVAM
jgi:hypothetical protein